MIALKRLAAPAGFFWVTLVLVGGGEPFLFCAKAGWLSMDAARRRIDISIRCLDRMRHVSQFASMHDMILHEDERVMKRIGSEGLLKLLRRLVGIWFWEEELDGCGEPFGPGLLFVFCSRLLHEDDSGVVHGSGFEVGDQLLGELTKPLLKTSGSIPWSRAALSPHSFVPTPTETLRGPNASEAVSRRS